MAQAFRAAACTFFSLSTPSEMSETGVQLRRTAELIGLFGVMASLIFVGLETRQSAAATRAATAQEVTSAFRDINLAMAGDEELTRILVEFGLNPESASPVEQARLMAFWRAAFHIYSNVFYQNLNGTVAPQLYEGMVSEVSTWARSGLRSVFWAWESERFIYPAGFRNFMDSVSATAVSEPNLELLDSLNRRWCEVHVGRGHLTSDCCCR